MDVLLCSRLPIGLVLLPFIASYYHDIIGFVRARGWETLFIGGIGLGLTQGTAFTALSYRSVVNFGVIFGTAPIITMALARIVLREPMSVWQIAGALTAFAGIIVIAVHVRHLYGHAQAGEV